jgi:hypothetical protein
VLLFPPEFVAEALFVGSLGPAVWLGLLVFVLFEPLPLPDPIDTPPPDARAAPVAVRANTAAALAAAVSFCFCTFFLSSVMDDLLERGLPSDRCGSTSSVRGSVHLGDAPRGPGRQGVPATAGVVAESPRHGLVTAAGRLEDVRRRAPLDEAVPVKAIPTVGAACARSAARRCGPP